MIFKRIVAIAAVCALGVSSPDPQPAALTIHMKNSLFAPTSVSVHVGDTVAFANDDEITHNVTSDVLKSGDISGGKSWTFHFANPGTYRFICTYHPWMKGAIDVKAGQ